MLGPLDGSQMYQLLVTPCVASSLVVVALGSSDLTGRFYFRTLNIGKPTTIVCPVLDMVAISLSVEGVVCEEQEGSVSIYNVLYCILQGSGVSRPRFRISRGLENSLTLLHAPTSAHIPAVTFPPSLSPSLRLKEMRETKGRESTK
jgi:hypothetical protein